MKYTSFQNLRILITGGTGSWGQELTKQLLAHNPAEIIIYSRGEHKQVEMKRRFFGNPNLRFVIGDIRDKARLLSVSKGVDIIFHLAALKHVPVCEENPYESVLTNVTGAQNVVEAALENGVGRVVDVSTDKAVDPLNIYGTCKAVGEKLITAANRESKHTDFVCIRWGNVLGTNGSVVPLFIEQIKKANAITITDGSMTRFIMQLSQAIGLVLKASLESMGGEVFVMNMDAVRVSTIASAIISEFGNAETTIRTIGFRPGEKKHELLVSQYEAPQCRILDESYFVILPTIDTFRDYSCYSHLAKFEHPFFGSDNARELSEAEFLALITRDGWLDVDKPKASMEELSTLSKEEIIEYFSRQSWK